MGKFDVQAGYGRFADAAAKGFKVKAAKADTKDVDGKFNFKENGEAWFAQGHAKVMDKVTLGAFYTHFAKDVATEDATEFAGVNANVQLTDALSLDGEYVRSLNLFKDADHKSHLWTAGATYDFGKATPVSYTHLRAHETSLHLVCRLLLEKKKLYPSPSPRD